MEENKDLMAKARASLSGKWGWGVGLGTLCAVIMLFLYSFQYWIAPPSPGEILSHEEEGIALLENFTAFVFFPPPFQLQGAFSLVSFVLGCFFLFIMVFFSLKVAQGKAVKLEEIFSESFQRYFAVLRLSLAILFFTFLWTLLFFIPGIIASLAYSQSFYLLAENPSLGVLQAMKKSRLMMRGYKTRYFLLSLRFLGWFLLCLLTFGIGFLWLHPYVFVSYAHFYKAVSAMGTAPPAAALSAEGS